METSLLETRSIYVRKAHRTRAQVFITMLACWMAYTTKSSFLCAPRRSRGSGGWDGQSCLLPTVMPALVSGWDTGRLDSRPLEFLHLLRGIAG